MDLVTIHLGREERYWLLLAVFIPLEQHCTDSDRIALDEKVPLKVRMYQHWRSSSGHLQGLYCQLCFWTQGKLLISRLLQGLRERGCQRREVLYEPTVPTKALTSFMVLGSGIRLIAATRPGSIRRRPPPTMKPRHSATRRRYFKCVLMSGASISRSSK
ncbi:uncharacterized protein LOC121467303 [Drosophila elegans]|uniref:uncharacterized protein LOC121467303 n=1 Tax=Drosophila elegans TaxID=30023 RepID=UPI001BC837F7|nr:uncharacterized protein LOC121467303 [Drosophila elegans]